jgi:hypothetical protein
MLGEFKPVAFEDRRRRRRVRVPRWLLLLGAGLAIGAGGVVYVQERHLPPRLSYDAAQRLTERVQQLEAEGQQLAAALAQAQQQLQSASAGRDALAARLDESRRTAQSLQADVAALVGALPPDPRGGAVAVRVGRFRADAGQLAYDVLLTRDDAGAQPLRAQMQLVVSGQAARGAETSVTLPPVPVSIATHQSLSGEAPLPDGFTPQQAAVRITDAGGALLGSRILHVR